MPVHLRELIDNIDSSVPVFMFGQLMHCFFIVGSGLPSVLTYVNSQSVFIACLACAVFVRVLPLTLWALALVSVFVSTLSECLIVRGNGRLVLGLVSGDLGVRLGPPPRPAQDTALLESSPGEPANTHSKGSHW